MKTFILYFLSALLTLPAFSQRGEDPDGQSFLDVRIVVSKEHFQLTEAEHKELVGLYLEGSPFTVLQKQGLINKYQALPFEIHVQGDAISKVKLSDLKIAVFRYLQADASEGFGFTTDSRFIEFDYRNFGLNEPQHNNLAIMDLAIATTKTGLRYTSKNGNYYILGGVVGFGAAGKIRGDLDGAGLNPMYIDPLFVNKTKHYNESSSAFIFGGGFTEINLNEKFRLYGSASWGARSSKANWTYTINEPTEENKEINYRQIDLYGRRSRVQLRAEANLGELLTPYLTGVSLNAGLDLNRFIIDHDLDDRGTALYPYQSTTINDKKDLKDFNQLQFSVGLVVSPSAIIKRGVKGRKYKSMADFYK